MKMQKVLKVLLLSISIANCYIYNLPKFRGLDKDQLTQKQLELTEYFESYDYIDKVEEFQFNQNTEKAIILLRQCHFEQGTVRITKPGIYILQENITFSPNSDTDFLLPTQEQSELYPNGINEPYILGFFAAITVETQGVIIDLNGYKIEQSLLHNIVQRFYAHIELANSPFVSHQGPTSFTSPETFKSSFRVLVTNGQLGLSAHHGIHGNQMTEIILYDLKITDFEQAGIQLNGASESIIANVTVKNNKQYVPLKSSYFQAFNVAFFLTVLQRVNNEAFLTVDGVDISINTMFNQILQALFVARQEILNGNVPSEKDFGNINAYDGLDANVYGIVLNRRGIVTNDFIIKRESGSLENYNIYLQDIKIKNILSKPIEYVALSTQIVQDEGGNRMLGPLGDVFDINEVVDPVTQQYKQNLLANGQLLIAKYKDQIPFSGTNSIDQRVVQWVENQTCFNDLLSQNKDLFLVYGGDSMGHIMKGNIGLFISSGDNIKIIGTVIKEIVNLGDVTADKYGNKQGSNAYALVVTGSTDVYLEDQKYKKIQSFYGQGAESFSIYSTILSVD